MTYCSLGRRYDTVKVISDIQLSQEGGLGILSAINKVNAAMVIEKLNSPTGWMLEVAMAFSFSVASFCAGYVLHV
jgi:hypothetical protein